MFFDRNWKISESEKIESVIARVQAHDNEQDILTFGLEQDGLNGADADEPLPFRIDPHTGIVYLNETLEGRGGQNFFLYVTVSDGAVTAKNQVYVNIKAKNDVNNGNRPPSFTPNTTGLFPPFHMLPGVQPPNRPKPFPFPITPPASPPISDTNFNSQSPDSNAKPNATTSNGNASIPPSNVQRNGSRTHEIPFGANSNGTVVNSIDDGHTNGTTNTTNTFTRAPLNTVLPFAIIICGVIVASGLIVSSFIFRKRLCAIGKSLKKKSKEEMAKKSNQSNFSSSSNNGGCEDSRNSIVMQHWNGPTAFSNRYVPWERENTHIQVRTPFRFSSLFFFASASDRRTKRKEKRTNQHTPHTNKKSLAQVKTRKEKSER